MYKTSPFQYWFPILLDHVWNNKVQALKAQTYRRCEVSNIVLVLFIPSRRAKAIIPLFIQ